MQITAKQTDVLQGIITPPPSKSDAVRALIFALLCKGTSHIDNVLEADDIEDAIEACKTLGATVVREGAHITIASSGVPFSPTQTSLYTGNSGITTRFMAPLLGLRANHDTPMTLNCGAQMKTRPMGALLTALQQLGMKINHLETPHSLPISTTGAFTGGMTTLTEPISQYLSALAIAMPLAPNTSTVKVSNIPARAYLEMTFEWLDRLGINYACHHEDNVDTITVFGNQRYHAFNHTISGDFSSASYFIAAGVLFPGTIRLKGLNMQDAQGDKQLVDIILEMGGNIAFDGDDMIITGGSKLRGIRIDASKIPDLLPTLAVLGTAASGQTELFNVSQARFKETDRIHSMTEGLSRLGACVEEKQDGMIIYPSSLTGTHVKGYGDHRTVMALSLAGLLATGTTIIADAESIRKTFPHFVDEMKNLGARMEISA